MKNIFSLDNRIAVVTGGAGLIGKALVSGLAQSGAKVYIGDIDETLGNLVKVELSSLEQDVEFLPLDITSETSVTNFIDSICKTDKKLDIWVNNAYPRTADWGTKFESMNLESWRKNIDLQLNSYVLCSQKAAEQMKNQNGGSIINMASIYGIVAPDFSIYSGTEMTMPAAYSAIKGAIVNFTKYLASYYGSYQVRVNSVSPGGIFDNQPDSFVARYCLKTLVGRMGTPEDIVGAVVYLASDASSYITGQNLIVDGGLTAT